MHPAIIIGTVRSLIVDVAMGQIPRSTERISSLLYEFFSYYFIIVCNRFLSPVNPYQNKLLPLQTKRLFVLHFMHIRLLLFYCILFIYSFKTNNRRT